MYKAEDFKSGDRFTLVNGAGEYYIEVINSFNGIIDARYSCDGFDKISTLSGYFYINKIKSIEKQGEKQMKKSDLKNGMIVEDRDGEQLVFVKTSTINPIFVGDCFKSEMEEYSETLTWQSCVGHPSDIVKIYDAEERLIWTRNEESETDKKIRELQEKLDELKKLEMKKND